MSPRQTRRWWCSYRTHRVFYMKESISRCTQLAKVMTRTRDAKLGETSEGWLKKANHSNPLPPPPPLPFTTTTGQRQSDRNGHMARNRAGPGIALLPERKGHDHPHEASYTPGAAINKRQPRVKKTAANNNRARERTSINGRTRDASVERSEFGQIRRRWQGGIICNK